MTSGRTYLLAWFSGMDLDICSEEHVHPRAFFCFACTRRVCSLLSYALHGGYGPWFCVECFASPPLSFTVVRYWQLFPPFGAAADGPTCFTRSRLLLPLFICIRFFFPSLLQVSVWYETNRQCSLCFLSVSAHAASFFLSFLLLVGRERPTGPFRPRLVLARSMTPHRSDISLLYGF